MRIALMMVVSLAFVAPILDADMAAALPPNWCQAPCHRVWIRPCPTCPARSRCECPPGGGTWSGSGSYGSAEIHKKNVPVVKPAPRPRVYWRPAAKPLRAR